MSQLTDEQRLVSEWYAQQARMFPDARLTFLNYGYLGETDSFDWLKAEDLEQKCSINLIHSMLDGADLTGRRVLEIGCGRGGNCSYLSKYANADTVIGLDFCDAHVEFCRAVHQLDGVSFLEGDAQTLPFDDEHFDVVVNIESSHAYPNLEKFGREVHRVLKNNGIFYYADTMPGHNPVQLSPEELQGVEYFTRGIQVFEHMIANSGFTLLKEADITDGVIRSFQSREGHLRHLMKKLLDEKQQQTEIPEPILQSIATMLGFFEGNGLNAYRKGYLIYKYWKLGKN